MSDYESNLKNDYILNRKKDSSLNKILNILDKMENHTCDLRKSIINMVRDKLIKNKNIENSR